jgi:hypothetical protein
MEAEGTFQPGASQNSLYMDRDPGPPDLGLWAMAAVWLIATRGHYGGRLATPIGGFLPLYHRVQHGRDDVDVRRHAPQRWIISVASADALARCEPGLGSARYLATEENAIMAHLVVLVLDNLTQSPHVLEAKEEAGVSGVTIVESTRLRRVLGAMRDDLPLIPSLRDILAGSELHHRTLFSVIEDETTLDRVIASAERVVGDFGRPHSDLLSVIPVTQVLGLRKSAGETTLS